MLIHRNLICRHTPKISKKNSFVVYLVFQYIIECNRSWIVINYRKHTVVDWIPQRNPFNAGQQFSIKFSAKSMSLWNGFCTFCFGENKIIGYRKMIKNDMKLWQFGDSNQQSFCMYISKNNILKYMRYIFCIRAEKKTFHLFPYSIFKFDNKKKSFLLLFHFLSAYISSSFEHSRICNKSFMGHKTISSCINWKISAIFICIWQKLKMLKFKMKIYPIIAIKKM